MNCAHPLSLPPPQNSKLVFKLPADISHRPLKVSMSKMEFINTPPPTVPQFPASIFYFSPLSP